MTRDPAPTDLPGWSGAAKRRVLDRVAEGILSHTERAARFARGDPVTEEDNRYLSLLWLTVDGSGVDPGVDPTSADYADDVIDTDPTARLLNGFPAGSLGPAHPEIPGIGAQYDVPDERADELTEAALLELDDPRDAVVHLWAGHRDLDLSALHAYGRGVANDSRVDPASRDAPRRFGGGPAGAAPAPGRLVDAIDTPEAPAAYLFTPEQDADGYDPGDSPAVAVVAGEGRAALVLDDDPGAEATVAALDGVEREAGPLTVDTVVVRGSEPYDHPEITDRDDYDPRDTLTELLRSPDADLSDADVVLEDVQAGRENAAALAAQVDRGNDIYAMRGRFYDDGALADALDRVDDVADRDVDAATTRLWKRDEVATLGGRAALQFAGGFREDEPDGRRAVGLVTDGANLLLPGDATAYDVAMDSGRDWDVVDCRSVRGAGLAGNGERPDGTDVDLAGAPLSAATPILHEADAAVRGADDPAFAVGDGPLAVSLGDDPVVETVERSTEWSVDR